MKNEKLLEAIGKIDEELVFAAVNDRPEKKNTKWIKRLAAAACVCLIAGFFAAERPSEPVNDYPVLQELVLEGINCGYVRYETAGANDLEKYSIEREYVITESDLGELIGTVGESRKKEFIGSKIYHYAKYPEDETIVIIETEDGYAFCVGRIYFFGFEAKSTDEFFEAHGLPDSVGKIEVAPTEGKAFVIENEADIKAFFDILSGNANTGAKQKERRLAKLWYETYGNNEIYFDEETGRCVLPGSSSEGEPLGEKERETIILARKLWDKGECNIIITTKNGFEAVIYYTPSIDTLYIGGGYYELSPEKAKEFEKILEAE